MATETERLLFLLEANTKRFENALAKADRDSDRRFANMEKRAQLMERRLQKSMADAMKAPPGGFDIGAIGDLRALIAATGVGVAIGETVKLADAYTNLVNQMKLYSDGAEATAKATQFVIDTAANARVPLEELSRVYISASRSAVDLGLNVAETEMLAEATARAAAMGTTSAAGMAGALMQFSQAIGSGMVQAEEFNSIMDGTPALALALARGIDEAGGSVSKLRTLVRDGEISSQQFAQALLRELPRIRAEFESMTPSISQSMEVLRTRFIEFIGGADDAAQATENISKFILRVADDLELFGDAAIVFVGSFVDGAKAVAQFAVPLAALSAAIFAVRAALQAVAAVALVNTAASLATGAASATVMATAVGGLTTALRGMAAAAMAFIATPLGAAVTAVSLAVGYATIKTLEHNQAQQEAIRLDQERTASQDRFSEAINRYTLAEGEAKAAALASLQAQIAQQRAIVESIRLKDAEAAATTAAARAEVMATRARLESARALREANPLNLRHRIGVERETENEQRALENLSAVHDAEQEINRTYRSAVAILDNMEAQLAQATRPVTLAGSGVRPNPKDSASSTSSADAAARRAEQERIQAARRQQDAENRELEHQLELARLRQEDVRAQEDLLAARRIAAQMDENGLINAENLAKAQQQVAQVRQLTNQQLARETAAREEQIALAEAMAAGDWEAVRRLERAAEIRDKTNEYLADGIGLIEAQAKAEADVDRLRAARRTDAEREYQLEVDRLRVESLRVDGLHEEADVLEQQLEYNEILRDLEERSVENAAEKARFIHEQLRGLRDAERANARLEEIEDRRLSLARLRGETDDEIRRIENDIELRRRTAQVARDRKINQDEARVIVQAEMDEEDQARVRGQVRAVWRDGIRAALKGDVEPFVEQMFDRVMDRLADQLTDLLFDFIDQMKANQGSGAGGIGEGTGQSRKWWETAGSWLSSFFGGKRELGGPVSAGKAYLVGEKGPELFTASHSGRITTADRTARMVGGGGGGAPVINVYANDAVLASHVFAEIRRATALAVAASPAYTGRQQARQSRYSAT